ncbi:hypothetical protein CAPTEDRAFT_152268 [Capitella teleta]|uniref:Elongator complex protein 1 n=1 Tax=Capitella teleta TaxID=283909 RepID=R7TJU7_CAPTE|nr:hypothetical protein CAPTEDRAFT_152268 [Capitella teleta]|eukprot:ELT93767.1 hypothetical protein CAPTEDRAFT_152268 [Capitella teleta]
MAVCFTTTEGDVFLWNTTSSQLENVGCVESGITSMAWSPDCEVLILTTGDNKMVMMTREFDILSEDGLCPRSFGEAEFVNVGWGRKETQFHGTEGKDAAKVKAQQGAREAFSWDDRRPRVTWQGDGQYFAISIVNPQSGSREVRVWSRDGVLHSSSEAIDGLEQALHWRPSGGFLASSQRKPHRHNIAFIERNGLKHGEFTLPFGVNEVKVNEVMWSNDSSILAVHGEYMSDGKSFVEMWVTANHHWYMKQHLSFNEKVTGVIWDPEIACVLHVVTSNQYMQYTWTWVTTRTSGQQLDDQALVAVTNGANLLVTPFRSMTVPPPMSAYRVEMPAAIQQVAFSVGRHSNNFLVLLSNNTLAYYGFTEDSGTAEKEASVKACNGSGFKLMCSTPCLKALLSISGDALPAACYPAKVSHLTFVDDSLLFFVTLTSKGSGSILHQAKVSLETSTIEVCQSIEVGHSILATCFNRRNQQLILQTSLGALLAFDPASQSLAPWRDASLREVSLPQPSAQMEVASLNGQDVVFALTDRFRFFANDLEVASNCSSFVVHFEFLLLTTLSHTCRCIPLSTRLQGESNNHHTKSINQSFADLPGLSDARSHPFDESVRRVERGSRIVCSVAMDTKLVLQMPRGNLEVIEPRALVLSKVRTLIDQVRYKEAFVVMRKHRINLNLLHDHNPSAFMENIREFVKQVDSVSHINLFLTDLQAEDVTLTMYTVGSCERAAVSNKVDAVCDAMRKVIQEIDAEKFLLSILTTHVKKQIPELDVALQLIRELKENFDSYGVSGQSSAFAEDALKYLLFLVDVNELYDVALGSYDFSLVLMVAEKSQKDPKEYLPFLNNLRKMDENYQKFSIDVHLKRYESALGHIVNCGSERFDECLSLVTQHNLFNEALKLYNINSDEYKDIAIAYGEHLISQRSFEEAGIVFSRCKQHSLAMDAFERAHNWRQCVCSAQSLGCAQDQLKSLVMRLTVYLKDHRMHSEAALLLDQYADDQEEAIVTLIEGGQWEESLRMMHRYKRLDFIETNLITALKENHLSQMELLTSNIQLFQRYKNRLNVVREEKEKKRREMMELGDESRPGAMDSDLFSDTSSATGESVVSSKYSASSQASSSSSKMSGKSSKNRRKAERKLHSLKEGSRFEDLALLEALHLMYTQVDSWTDEVGALIRSLSQFNFTSEAEQLQRLTTDWVQMLRGEIDNIWLTTETTVSPALTFGPNSTANAVAEAMQNNGLQTVQAQPTEPLLQKPILKIRDSWKLKICS